MKTNFKFSNLEPQYRFLITEINSVGFSYNRIFVEIDSKYKKEVEEKINEETKKVTDCINKNPVTDIYIIKIEEMKKENIFSNNEEEHLFTPPPCRLKLIFLMWYNRIIKNEILPFYKQFEITVN